MVRPARIELLAVCLYSIGDNDFYFWFVSLFVSLFSHVPYGHGFESLNAVYRLWEGFIFS